ncbi:tRNA modification GTPase MnmE [uncultured Eubacterium sp.]|uniref:[FeFe] hydrogenase H-cluster maturation GTPase HydF n=1 Tax=Brotomerdimonas butyrica TaxID=2981721 RepID=UPI000821E79D|nr:[FeFe] hydrogenase H-cluster maturation GTPase HydF [Brotomerdimonas butyrica]SCI04984.1 tRNA modification GTPase MnmE [uncultured Eubacterium sp.]
MSLNDTPRAGRLHIGIYGRRNAGKSSLINALTGQDIALVSDAPGTTTDPIYKSMELHPVGPVVFIDTAGFDDEGTLGRLRVERTAGVVDKTDVGIIVIDNEALEKAAASSAAAPADAVLAEEKLWAEKLAEKNVPLIFVLNKCDEMQAPGESGALTESCGSQPAGSHGSHSAEAAGTSANVDAVVTTASGQPTALAADTAASVSADPQGDGRAATATAAAAIAELAGKWPVIKVSALHKTGIEELRQAIEQSVPEDFLREKILGDMVEEGGLVLLVMPQDIQAPKGRLILPQVQTLRELLDRKCTAVATTADGFERALSALNRVPDLIITDSQCFGQVYEKKPAESALTSFSVLFAAYKGDIDKFVSGASLLNDMTENSRVLIAEACTHVPLSEDIGREKIPNLLRKKFGKGIEVVNVCGNDFPSVEELKGFDLVIHCGACMFNRKHVMSRIAAAEAAGVPITNYGVVLAKLTGILDKIELPG